MALGDAYLTTAEFKARTRSTVSANDSAIAAVLLSASRSIDGFCGREFNKSATAEARVFEPYGWYGSPGYWHRDPVWPWVETGDIVSVEGIASGDSTGAFGDAWDADTYALLPRNAAAKGFPYTEIGPGMRWSGWPLTAYGVQVTGIWGFPSVPAPVKEACFLIANRLKSLADAPFGASGGGDMGQLDMTTSMTPIIEQMLAPYRVRTV